VKHPANLYSVPASSIAMLESAAETSCVAVLNISHSVEDLDTRLATSLSKELSNSVSTGSFVVCQVVKPTLTGP